MCNGTCAALCERLPNCNLLCRQQLPDAGNLGAVIEAEPRLLAADVDALICDVKRLLPDRDPHQFLLSNPTVRPCACLFTLHICVAMLNSAC